MATFLLLPWSRRAIGRVRGTPGALSTAGRPRWTDGLSNPRRGKGGFSCLNQLAHLHLSQSYLQVGACAGTRMKWDAMSLVPAG
jgi:hypothetical protein